MIIIGTKHHIIEHIIEHAMREFGIRRVKKHFSQVKATCIPFEALWSPVRVRVTQP